MDAEAEALRTTGGERFTPHPPNAQVPVLPRRWLIVGSSGAGKSSLAVTMSQILGLPVIHLDKNYWKSGWVESDRKEWAEKVEKLIEGDAPDLPDDCPEHLPDWEFLWFVLSYPWRSRPKVLRQIAAHPHVSLTRLRSGREVEEFLEGLRSLQNL